MAALRLLAIFKTLYSRMAKRVSQWSQGRSDWCRKRAVSKSQSHPDMARLKSQPGVEPLRIDAGPMREQFNQLATLGARFRDGPLHHLLSNATAAAMRGDANVLDQAARGALRA